MDPVIGEVQLFAGNFAPRSWAFCNGQLLPISQYEALFTILGTTYGGDGVTTFALPDLRGRAAVHPSTNSVPVQVELGQTGGVPEVTLISNQLPMHNHALNASTSAANNAPPQNAIPAILTDNSGTELGYMLYQNGNPNAQMNAQAVGNTGGNQPHENTQPYLGLNYIIALEGIYPSRN